jgi:hypothetical protein
MDYTYDALYIIWLDVGNPNTGHPSHQTTLPSSFSSGNAWYYYLSIETTENM